LSKNGIFARFLGENIFKITTSVPVLGSEIEIQKIFFFSFLGLGPDEQTSSWVVAAPLASQHKHK
jgi:hypothetical protein